MVTVVKSPLSNFVDIFAATYSIRDAVRLLILTTLSPAQVLQLRGMCLGRLIQSVSAANIIDYIISADACSEEGLVGACLAFASENRYHDSQ